MLQEVPSGMLTMQLMSSVQLICLLRERGEIGGETEEERERRETERENRRETGRAQGKRVPVGVSLCNPFWLAPLLPMCAYPQHTHTHTVSLSFSHTHTHRQLTPTLQLSATLSLISCGSVAIAAVPSLPVPLAAMWHPFCLCPFPPQLLSCTLLPLYWVINKNCLRLCDWLLVSCFNSVCVSARCVFFLIFFFCWLFAL